MKYRKKPIIVDAFKWTGGQDQTEDPEWIDEALKKDVLQEDGSARILKSDTPDCYMTIHTPEGHKTADPGDYIIREENGQIYPCKPGMFEATYEKVES